jgi:hypothetical protein
MFLVTIRLGKLVNTSSEARVRKFVVSFVVVRDRDGCEYFGGAPILHNPGRADLHPNLLAGMTLFPCGALKIAPNLGSGRIVFTWLFVLKSVLVAVTGNIASDPRISIFEPGAANV